MILGLWPASALVSLKMFPGGPLGRDPSALTAGAVVRAFYKARGIFKDWIQRDVDVRK